MSDINDFGFTAVDQDELKTKFKESQATKIIKYHCTDLIHNSSNPILELKLNLSWYREYDKCNMIGSYYIFKTTNQYETETETKEKEEKEHRLESLNEIIDVIPNGTEFSTYFTVYMLCTGTGNSCNCVIRLSAKEIKLHKDL